MKKSIFTFILLSIITPQSLSQHTIEDRPIPPPPVTATCVYSFFHALNVYACHLHNATVAYPQQTLVINGKHLANHTDADVGGVFPGRDLNLRFFNGEVTRKFINLQILHLREVQLTGFGPSAFDSCAQLRTLEISFANMSTVPQGMLRNCGQLRRFDVSATTISSLPANLFGATQSLEEFRVVSSLLTTLPSTLFQHALNLNSVDLQVNHISNLDRSLFSNVLSLESVTLSSNRISESSVVVNLLNGQVGLRRLGLANAGLASFDFNFFRQFARLEQLHVSVSPHFLTGISWSALPGSLLSLSVLDIGEPVPENALTALTSLTWLSLGGNRIQNLEPNTFRHQLNLQQLFLSNCGLTSLHPALFTPLQNLRHLSMPFNEIEELPPGIFASLTRLGDHLAGHSLFLMGNRIRRLNADAFGVHPNLTTVIMSANRLYEIERGVFSRSFPNLRTFSGLQNLCVSDIIVRDFDESPFLEYCFANWLGETTSTTTTTDGGERNGAGVLGLIVTALIAVLVVNF